MQKTLMSLGFAAGICLLCGESAGAIPANGAALQPAEITHSAVQQAQYYERHTRHGVVKCFRDFVVGPYRCHYYRAPF
jgi:hypothetical protein